MGVTGTYEPPVGQDDAIIEDIAEVKTVVDTINTNTASSGGMKYTSVTIAEGKSATLPRSTDLANAVCYNTEWRYWYVYGSANGGWGAPSGTVTLTVSSSGYTVGNDTGDSITIYYGYTE